ncbi:hypothetical protein SHKM778_29200 [Streptomyces sp. KM77-8]|uniref:Bacterial bifunctional deaminase-reductase C-terminal domain-containing protein n=1 Tax=Streptomyces haneummycinicus TaxID=3074435 RepID=A0AAT9HGU8_9ACTN
MEKRTESNRGGGTISATSRSAGTRGSRAHSESGATSAIGPGREAAEEDDTVPHATGRGTLPGMRRLFPVTDVTDETAVREWGLAELAAAYAYPGGGREPWLRANMVSTLDGAAQHDGRSKRLSHPADMRIFGVLRALADVVVVGARTVRQEGYRPARARAEFAAARRPPDRARARDRRGDGEPGPGLLPAAVHLSARSDAAADRRRRRPGPGRRGGGGGRPGGRRGEGAAVDPARAVRALAGLGHTRLLTEGGPRLLGDLIAAGVLDEICLDPRTDAHRW